MLTAHLPSGYCLAKIGHLRGMAFGAALIGAVFPDIDMVFFHLVDDRAFHHHRYWVHVPVFWAAVAAVTLPILWRTRLRVTALAFFAALLLHLVLDSIGGGVMWLAPFDTELWSLVTVPPRYGHWVTSFILHWTFALEICVWLAALGLYRASRRNNRNQQDMP